MNERIKPETAGSLLPFANRPDTHIKLILDAFASLTSTKKFAKRSRLHFDKPGNRYCCIISSGIISVRRKKDDLTIASTYGPSIIGIANVVCPIDLTYLFFETAGEVMLVPEETFMEYVNRDNLWPHLVYIQSFIIQNYSFRDIILVGRTTYEIICSHLLMLMNEHESIRKTISAANYIIQRTYLSRSSVMRILQDLRHGGYIEINWGRLTHVHSLPERY